MVAGNDLQRFCAEAESLVAFTGAGISAESGIPTYRGAGGVWHKYDPSKYADIGQFLEDPSYYWSFFRDVRYPVLRAAEPNAAHRALARLEERGRLRAVITQNIDGLHQAAGSHRVLELHGNTRRIRCMKCGGMYTMDEVYRQIESRLPPLCSGCNGPLKPDVVFFGESLPHDVLEKALTEARSCDLFLVVGSSLVVHPAASLPMIAKEGGARVVIVNRDPTPLDPLADLVIRDGASDTLSGLGDP
jgi:NAD-dependent deacetylase